MLRILTKLFVMVLVVAGAGLAWTVFHFLAVPPSDIANPVIVEVHPGSSLSSVAEELESKGIITDQKKFTLLARVLGLGGKVKVGEYSIAQNLLPREVITIIASGKSIQHNIVIPEGYNIFEIRAVIDGMWPGKGEEFYKLVTNPEFAESLTKRKLRSLEGYLFPDTYVVTKFTPVRELVTNMYHNFEKNIEEASKSPKVNMSLHEQVILASVIEKETGAPEERPMISSVFHNRIRKGMRLQSDPTIIYGMMVESGNSVSNIRKEDILHPTPYNTYTVKALPVGPISNPGRESLWAALNPTESNYLYFVSRNDGTHVFSERLDAHNKAVQNFQLDRKARQGKSWRNLKKRK